MSKTLPKHYRRVQGFTLIELLIVIVLMLVVMLMIAFMFGEARKLYTTATLRNQVSSQGRLAIDTLRRDLSGILPLDDSSTGAITKDLILHSAEPQSYTDWDAYVDTANSRATGADIGPVYQDTPFEMIVQEGSRIEKNSLEDIRPVLAFKTRTRWWNADENRFDYGLAQVVYYLKLRKPIDVLDDTQFQPGGAYLMRLVVPIIEPNRLITGQQALRAPTPREEDVCSAVLAMRIQFLNHASAVANALSQGTSETYPLFSAADDRDSRATEAFISKIRRGDFGSSGGGGGGTNDEAIQVNSLPKYSFEFGTNAGSVYANEGLVVSVSNYPALIAIDLVLANDDFENQSSDGESVGLKGTVRHFRAVVALPGVVPETFIKKDALEDFKND